MSSCRTSRPAPPIGSGSRQPTLRARYPRLIVCSVSGYGSSGPYASKKAYDLLVQSEVGLVSLTGTEDAPSQVGISVADIAAGMYAYSGILTALLRERRPGRGTVRRGLAVRRAGRVDGRAGVLHGLRRHRRRRAPAPQHASIAPYEPFATREGVDVYLGDPERARVDAVLRATCCGQPELADDPRFRTRTPSACEHRAALDAGDRRVVREHVRRQNSSSGSSRPALPTPARTRSADFVEHPQLRRAIAGATIDSPAGPLRALAAAGRDGRRRRR